MKLQRFIIPKVSLHGDVVITDPEVIGQMRKVFRFKKGDQCIVCDGDGKEAVVRIEQLAPAKAVCAIEQRSLNEHDPARQLTLCCAVLKRENFEWVVQKATEVGVARIIPVRTQRMVKQELKYDRLEKIAHEAAEQSGRGRIPFIEKIMDLEDAILTQKRDGTVYVMDGEGTDIRTLEQVGSPCTICIGPEGGFSEEEITFFKEENVALVSMGSLTLRAETAAIVASYVLVNK